MIKPLQVLRRPSAAGFSLPASRLVITDGEDVVADVRVASMGAALDKAAGLCWHPKRCAGPYRPEVREVEVGWWG